MRWVTDTVPAELCIGGRELFEPRLSADGHSVVYGEVDQKVVAICVADIGGTLARRIVPEPPMRSARGMGGGAWCFLHDDEHVAYTANDGNLWSLSLLDGTTCQITTVPDGCSAMAPVSLGGRIAYVVDLAEVRVVDLATNDDRRIDDGSDGFVIDPSFTPGGDLEWVGWSAPNMPWDESVVRRTSSDGRVAVVVSGGAVQQPRTAPDGRRFCVRDHTGHSVVWCDDQPVVSEPFDHAGPVWGAGARTFAWSPAGDEVAFTRNEGGFGRLCVADVATGAVREIGRGVHGQVSWRGDTIAAVRSGARTPTQLVAYSMPSAARTVIDTGTRADWSGVHLPEPDLVEIAASPTIAGSVVYARLYRSSIAESQRLIVWLHGGPTDQWQVSFMPRLAFWLSRGWHVLVPDHRGSTGHGRDYTHSLRERWGDLDVDDTVRVAHWAVEEGITSEGRMVVMGGSAGGFTALGAVAAAPGLFAAAAVAYPVTDLADLPVNSHRFEQHYTDLLVGPWPDTADRYSLRSPISWPERFVGTPLLVLHGDADPVVSVRQSVDFVAGVNAAGGDATLHVYAGEGHGFRDPANQLDEYRRLEVFLHRHAG